MAKKAKAKATKAARSHKRAAKASVQPPAAKRLAGGAGADQHYEGKQHYPAAVYGKKKDGTIVSRLVNDSEAFAELRDEDHSIEWAASPADHGLETHQAGDPAGAVAPGAPVESVVGKVDGK